MNKPKLSIFNRKSPFFVFLYIITFMLLFLFIVWIWGRCSNKAHKAYYQPTTEQVSSVGKVKYVEPEEEGKLPYLCKVDNNGNILDDFKILSLGDLHLNADHDDFALEVFRRFLDKEKPDFVVLDGDTLFQVRDTKWQKALIKVFEDRELYWTFALGNHDHQGFNRSGFSKAESRKVAFNTLTGLEIDGSGKRSKYCLASSANLDINTCGYGNHFINIKGSDNKTMQTLFMFDYVGIDGYNQTMIDWYLDSINKVKADSGLSTSPASIAFCHKTFYEMRWPSALKSTQHIKYISGDTNQIMRGLQAPNGLLDKFLENNTKKVIFGHNHANNACYEVTEGDKSLQFAYTCSLGYNCFSSRNFFHSSILSCIAYMLDTKNCWFNDGITNLYVKNGQDTIMFHKFCQKEGVFEGLERDLYFKCFFLVTYKGEWCNILNRVLLPIVAAGCIVYWGFVIDYYKKLNKKGKDK